MANLKIKESESKVSPGTTLAGVGIIPQVGFIMPFAGVTAPSGWALCDGTNGTPDLRGVSLIGATSAANIGLATGSDSHSHSYSFSNLNVSTDTNIAGHQAPTGNTTSIDNFGSHNHYVNIAINTASHYSGNFINFSNGNTTTRTFRSHDHVGSWVNTFSNYTDPGAHTHSVVSGTISINASTDISETGHTHSTATPPSGTTSSDSITIANIIMNYIMKV